MEESDTYLMIRELGEAMGARKSILLVGEERLGPPHESCKAYLDGITDLECLNRIFLRTITAASWQEILNTP